MIELKRYSSFLPTDNTSLNNNNNNHSMNNNTIKYSDKSTQTTDCNDCEASLKPAPNTDELIATETQTDFTNLHNESICCLKNIPYADMTNSPPPPPPIPYRRTNDEKPSENCNENHNELNQLSARNLQFLIDTNIGPSTQAAMATSVEGLCDNGDIQCRLNENDIGENL